MTCQTGPKRRKATIVGIPINDSRNRDGETDSDTYPHPHNLERFPPYIHKDSLILVDGHLLPIKRNNLVIDIERVK